MTNNEIQAGYGPASRFYLVFLFFIGVIFTGSAQTQLDQLGYPLISNYGPKDYNGAQQVWSIAQDGRGFIYFGVQPGLLEYDGVSWRRIRLDSKSLQLARSLAVDENGRVYFGAITNMGYIVQDEKGNSVPVSLFQHIPVRYRHFEDTWNTSICNGYVYFNIRENILAWKEGMDTMKVWTGNGNDFHGMFVVHDKLYVRQWNVGLNVMEGDSLRLLPGGEQFANERVYVMLPYDEQRILIGTRASGFFLFDGNNFIPFPTEIDDALKEVDLYLPGAKLDDGNFAIGTIGGGVYVLNKDGRIVKHLDRKAGVRDDFSTYVYEDNSGSLWIATTDGASKVETSSGLTYYDERIGVNSTVLSIISDKEGFYAGTEGPLLRFNPSTKSFTPISGTGPQTFTMQNLHGKLYAGNFDGIQRIVGDRATAVATSQRNNLNVTYFVQSAYDSNLVFIAAGNGVGLLRYKDLKWELDGFLPDFANSSWWITEEAEGVIWICDQVTGATRLAYPNWPAFDNPSMKHYGPDQGLPEDGYVGMINGKLYAASTVGVFRYEENLDQFRRDSLFGGDATYFWDGSDGAYWVAKEEQKGLRQAIPNGDGTYQLIDAPFSPLADDIIASIYLDPNQNITWIGTNEGLVRYDPTIPLGKPASFHVLIRKVAVQNDSLLHLNGNNPPIPYTNNQVNFEYAAPFFTKEDQTEYQSWLEGLDKHWSNWNYRTEREYINLPPGNYFFHVKARNIYKQETAETIYSFTILSPWYRTWWAIALYILGLGLCIWAFLSLRTRQLRKQRENLENIVSDRTKELELRVNELGIVNQVNEALASQLESSALIQLVGDQLRDLFNANIVYVALLDKPSGIISFPYGYGDDFPPLKLGQGLTSQIITSGEPLLLNQDVTANYDKMGIKKVGKVAASYLGVPIPVGKEIIGVLSVQSTQHTNRFNDADKNLLNTIAASVGVAIHNAALYDEAQQARADAERANEAKSSFLSTVSHELRTPLTSVLGFAKIVKKRLEERVFPALDQTDPKMSRVVDQVGKNMDVITSEGERLTQLINDVLDLAKIEAGKIEWHMEPCRIEAIIDRALEATHSLVEQKNLSVEKSIVADLPVVLADHNKLIQVVINLLSNAVKFTNHGNITLKAFEKEDHLIVSVTDTGIGIAPGDQSKVFEKFKQVGDTLTDKPQGTGLGLPICKEIIEHHGGRLWLESEIGKGSTFYFSIPVTEEAKTSLPPMELEALMKQLKERIDQSTHQSMPNVNTVLIVDDDPSIRGLLVQELGEAGYQIQEAENGKEALEKIRQQKPDLVLLDVMMPEMNGFDVAAILKNDPVTMDIPIIILSIVQDKERGMRIGVDKYLTKPFETDQLIQEVNALLEQGQSRKKIMVVDENATTVKTLSDVLQARGYQVVESNGSELLEKAKSLLPDVIILRSAKGEQQDIVKSLRFEKGMEHVVFLVYQ